MFSNQQESESSNVEKRSDDHLHRHTCLTKTFAMLLVSWTQC